MAEKLVNDGMRWEKSKIKTPDPYVDDGSRYIFPAGEAAPGSNIAPAAAKPAPAPQEIAGQVEQIANAPVAPQPQETFVNPNAPAERNIATTAPEIPQAAQPAAPAIDVPAIPTNQFADQEKLINDIGSQEQKLHEERAKLIQKQIEDDEKAAEIIEPKGFFEGKSTWQKILGGIGMFLGSITPEGARNVASMVEKEINRDIEAQKANIKLKQDKKDKRFQMMIQKYGSEEAALLAKKKTAFDLLDLQLKKLEMNARNAETRARLSMGREELNLKRQELAVRTGEAMMKAQKESSKGAIPGYIGSNQNPAMVKEVADRVAAGKAANALIDELEGLLKSGATVPFSDKRKLAQQSIDALAAEIAKSQAGGKYSDFEYEKARGMIPDITSLLQAKSVDKSLLAGLRAKVNKNVDSYASTAGYRRGQVSGAREIK
jgi:hypothetical protein